MQVIPDQLQPFKSIHHPKHTSISTSRPDRHSAIACPLPPNQLVLQRIIPSPPVTGLSLFHDNGRAHLVDDLSFLCGDIKFPVLSKCKKALTKSCGSTTEAKAIKSKRTTESSTFSSIKDMLSCRSHNIDSSFFDEKDFRQLSISSTKTVDSSLNFKEKDQTTCTTKSVSRFTSNSSEGSSEYGQSRFSTASDCLHTLDTDRIFQPAIIRRRRNMLPLWINTAISRFYPSNAESRHAQLGQGVFPSSLETLSLEFAPSPVGQGGFEVEVDRLAGGEGRRVDAIEMKQPRGKWNGNWI